MTTTQKTGKRWWFCSQIWHLSAMSIEAFWRCQSGKHFDLTYSLVWISHQKFKHDHAFSKLTSLLFVSTCLVPDSSAWTPEPNQGKEEGGLGVVFKRCPGIGVSEKGPLLLFTSDTLPFQLMIFLSMRERRILILSKGELGLSIPRIYWRSVFQKQIKGCHLAC